MRRPHRPDNTRVGTVDLIVRVNIIPIRPTSPVARRVAARLSRSEAAFVSVDNRDEKVALRRSRRRGSNSAGD